MRAVLLVNPYTTDEAALYQPRRIAEELAALGVEIDTVPNIWAAAIGRESLEESFSERYDFAVCLDKDKYLPRILEARGMRLFNRASAVETCDDKMLTHIALSGLVKMPRTLFAPLCYRREARAADTEKVAKELGYPVVVKECYGSLGAQVYLARDKEELISLSEQLKLRPHLYQEYIGESAGRDVRAVCVGGEIIACMERRSASDFRSNLSLGGTASEFLPTEEIRTICKKVTDRLQLDFCGIDLLFSDEGMLVCEVNSNAFFGGIERTTHINVARLYALHILRSI